MKKNFRKFASFISAFISMFTIFLAGNFHNDTKIEKCASYASEVVSKHTRNGEYSSLIVEPNQPDKKLCDSETEFYNLYGIFAESKVTFAPLYNADKKFDIHIKGFDSSSLSILYGGGVRTDPYNGHFKHRVYPIELMFEDVQYFYDFKYVVYISQKQADFVLRSDGVLPTEDGYTEKDYKSLLKKKIIIIIDSVEYEYIIQNIYYNENYYYDALTEVINDFVITSYYSYDVTKDHLQHVYFLKPYEYQNYYMMRYVKNLYGKADYNLSFGRENLISGVEEEKILSFYYLDDYSSIISISLVILSFLGLSFSFFALATTKSKERIDYICFFASLFSPYLVLKIFSFFIPHLTLFSYYSLKFNLFILLGCLLAAILFYYFKKYMPKLKKKIPEKFCEIHI